MAEKLRVAVGTVYPYDESRVRGGVEAVALYLTRAVAKRDDVELHVVSCNRAVGRSFVEKRGSITVHWLATGRRLYGVRAATIDAWRVREVYDQLAPDVIHAQHFGEYAIAARSTSRMVLTIHGLEALVPHMRDTSHFRGAVGRYRRWITEWLARQGITRASAVIDTSGGYVTRSVGTWLDGKPIYGVANPVSQDFFSLGEQHRSVAGAPLILWCGSISERKNVAGLVQAFAHIVPRLPEARLTLVGGVADSTYFDRVLHVIAEAGIEGKVKATGPIPQEQLLQAYQEAAVVAMPSIEETAPMALAQAMAAGKAVVASRVGGIPWMVEDGVTGYLVDAGDTEALADRMCDLLLDQARRERMGLAARKRAMSLFAADAVAAQTAQVYYEVVGTAASD